MPSKKYRQQKKIRQNRSIRVISWYMALTLGFSLSPLIVTIQCHIHFLSKVPSFIPNYNLYYIFQVWPLACLLESIGSQFRWIGLPISGAWLLIVFAAESLIWATVHSGLWQRSVELKSAPVDWLGDLSTSIKKRYHEKALWKVKNFRFHS